MIPLIIMLVAGTATFFGYRETRRFVRNRLRYVDAIHTGKAPWIAGTAAALLAAPVVWVVPFIGGGTALLFGIGVGSGFAAGRRDVTGGMRQIPPF